MVGLATVFGAGGGTSSYEEAEHTDLMLLWGSNARAAHPIFFHHVLKGIHDGMRLIVVDPRRTESAEWGDLWLGLDVGTDIALSNTMAREIIVNDLHHRAFIELATTGFEDYVASVMDWTLERGAEVTGLPAEVIREVAHAYAKADRAMICWTLGITEHHNAADNVLALINLGLLTGHVGRYGSGLNPLRGQNNVQGGGDMGAIPNKLCGFQDIETDVAGRQRFEQEWGVTILPKRGWHLSQMFEAMEEGELTALYVIGENPAVSEADNQKTHKLLANLDILIVQDIFLTQTAKMADVVLPAGEFRLRVRGHGDEQRTARAAGAAGAGASRQREGRHLDHRRSSRSASDTTGVILPRTTSGRRSAGSPRCTRGCPGSASRSSAGSNGPVPTSRTRARSSSMPACGPRIPGSRG